MLKLRHEQIATAQCPSDAMTIRKLADLIAADVAQTGPDIPAVLTRLNVRMLLQSLGRHGVNDLDAQAAIVTRFFAAGVMFAREPYSSRWRHILIARDMTAEAKINQLSHLLTQAEAALKE